MNVTRENYESVISVHMFVHRMVITEDILDDVVLSQTLRIHLSYWSRATHCHHGSNIPGRLGVTEIIS